MPNVTVPAAATGLLSDGPPSGCVVLSFPSGRPRTVTSVDILASRRRHRAMTVEVIEQVEMVVCRLAADYVATVMPAATALAFDAAAALLNRHHAGEFVSHGEAMAAARALVLALSDGRCA